MCFSLERISPTMLNLLLLLWEDCQSATKSPGRADLTLLFSVAAQEAKHSRAPKPILRWKVHFLHSSSPSSHSRSPTYNRNIKYLKTQPWSSYYSDWRIMCSSTTANMDKTETTRRNQLSSLPFLFKRGSPLARPGLQFFPDVGDL